MSTASWLVLLLVAAGAAAAAAVVGMRRMVSPREPSRLPQAPPPGPKPAPAKDPKPAAPAKDPKPSAAAMGKLDDFEQSQRDAMAREPVVPPRVSVRLVPQVPVRDLDAPRSWAGGHPRLPDDVSWPEGGGQPLAFLAQICLADLPRELWRGDGPRDGWLVFFISQDAGAHAVLHTKTLGDWRTGPSPGDAHWFRASGSTDGPSRPFAARWPLDVRVEREGEPAPEHPSDPFEGLDFDLARPELHPFDAETMLAALDVMQERVALLLEGKAKREAAEASGKQKPLGEADLALAVGLHESAAAAQRALKAITDDVTARGATFTAADVPSVVAALASIELRTIETQNRDEFLATGRKFREGPSSSLTRPVDQYGTGKWALLRPWIELGRYALTTEPDRVPAPARALLERKFARDAARSLGMGHAPDAWYHEEPEDDSDKVVLLELPTTPLLPWTWGDANNLLFGLPRDALREGSFEEVWISFSN